MNAVSALSVRMRSTLRFLLYGLMAVVLAGAWVMPSAAEMLDPPEFAHAISSTMPDAPDEAPGKLAHSCAHCQSHQLADLPDWHPVRASALMVIGPSWVFAVEHCLSVGAPPLPRPPQA